MSCYFCKRDNMGNTYFWHWLSYPLRIVLFDYLIDSKINIGPQKWEDIRLKIPSDKTLNVMSLFLIVMNLSVWSNFISGGTSFHSCDQDNTERVVVICTPLICHKTPSPTSFTIVD